MSGTLTTLGKILYPEDNAQRDAIHIAVMPITAGEMLRPGQHIGVTDDKRARTIEGMADYGTDSRLAKKLVGIVDPFLRRPVMAGQQFWLYLYPNTITSLRHDWTHPEIDK